MRPGGLEVARCLCTPGALFAFATSPPPTLQAAHPPYRSQRRPRYMTNAHVLAKGLLSLFYCMYSWLIRRRAHCRCRSPSYHHPHCHHPGARCTTKRGSSRGMNATSTNETVWYSLPSRRLPSKLDIPLTIISTVGVTRRNVAQQDWGMGRCQR